MKTIRYFLYGFLMIVIFSGCCDSTDGQPSDSRIKLKDTRLLNGHRYSILEVDSVEYLTRNSGGFIKLEKK